MPDKSNVLRLGKCDKSILFKLSLSKRKCSKLGKWTRSPIDVSLKAVQFMVVTSSAYILLPRLTQASSSIDWKLILATSTLFTLSLPPQPASK